MTQRIMCYIWDFFYGDNIILTNIFMIFFLNLDSSSTENRLTKLALGKPDRDNECTWHPGYTRGCILKKTDFHLRELQLSTAPPLGVELTAASLLRVGVWSVLTLHTRLCALLPLRGPQLCSCCCVQKILFSYSHSLSLIFPNFLPVLLQWSLRLEKKMHLLYPI